MVVKDLLLADNQKKKEEDSKYCYSFSALTLLVCPRCGIQYVRTSVLVMLKGF